MGQLFLRNNADGDGDKSISPRFSNFCRIVVTGHTGESQAGYQDYGVRQPASHAGQIQSAGRLSTSGNRTLSGTGRYRTSSRFLSSNNGGLGDRSKDFAREVGKLN